MATLQPIYTAENVNVAYQLLWSLSVFWREPVFSQSWLEELFPIAETDGVRILEHRFATPTASLFLISTRPELVPVEIPRVIKGRLQYLVRRQWPKAFQRNYDLKSIGSTTREKTEAYVALQLKHHLPDDPVLHAALTDLQIQNPEANLKSPRFAEHARYWCNLHMVFVHDGRTPETRLKIWQGVRNILRKSAKQKGWELSRVGFVPDHIHLAFGFSPAQSPLSVALSCMNNIAFVHGMRPVLMRSCYLGTIGEYDLGAIQKFEI